MVLSSLVYAPNTEGKNPDSNTKKVLDEFVQWAKIPIIREKIVFTGCREVAGLVFRTLKKLNLQPRAYSGMVTTFDNIRVGHVWVEANNYVIETNPSQILGEGVLRLMKRDEWERKTKPRRIVSYDKRILYLSPEGERHYNSLINEIIEYMHKYPPITEQNRYGGFSENTFNGTSKEGYYLNFNKDEIFKALIASEGHFRNFTSLKEDKTGFLNCIVKHLADAESHADEAISHALIAESEDSSRGFLELRDKIRDFRKYVQSSPITRDEGIREIRKLRRRFEAFNVDYDVSKCETCGDPAEVMEEITKILDDLKKTPLEVAAHEPEADEFICMEREMAEKLIAKLSEKYGVEPPEIVINDECHEPQSGLYSAGKIMVCQSGVNLHVLAHEFWHHVQSKKGMHIDEGEAEKFAVDLFEAPTQKGLYSMHNHSHSDRKMVKSIKDVGTIYGLQQLGFGADYVLKMVDTRWPAGLLGQPISLWGDILGTVGGVLGALYLKAPYDLVSAMVGGYLSTDLWNQAARLVPMRVAVPPPPLVYTPPVTVVRPPVTVPPPAVVARGRYVVI